eukprot:12623111-Prorocentrum_lima.AAC.1
MRYARPDRTRRTDHNKEQHQRRPENPHSAAKHKTTPTKLVHTAPTTNYQNIATPPISNQDTGRHI